MLPNITVAPDVKPVPVMVTDVPPAVAPDVGEMDVIVGGGTNVNWSAELVELVPYVVVTVMLTVPADSAGDMAVMESGEFTVTAVAVTLPKSTVEEDVKLAPVIVTEVPPLAGPDEGLTPITVVCGDACS